MMSRNEKPYLSLVFGNLGSFVVKLSTLKVVNSGKKEKQTHGTLHWKVIRVGIIIISL